MNVLKLKPVIRNPKGNSYCGPAVISALTQCTTDEASRLIRSINGKRSVKGTSYGDVIASLDLCGIRANLLYKYQTQKPTLAGWLDQTEHLRKPGRVFLIAAGRHWQLISSDTFVCGITSDVVDVTHDKVKRRSRVAAVWELTAKKVFIPEAAKKAPARELPNDAYERRCVRRIVAAYGLDFELIDKQEYRGWIYPPSTLPDEHDPLIDEHYFEDAKEALRKATSLAITIDKLRPANF